MTESIIERIRPNPGGVNDKFGADGKMSSKNRIFDVEIP